LDEIGAREEEIRVEAADLLASSARDGRPIALIALVMIASGRSPRRLNGTWMSCRFYFTMPWLRGGHEVVKI